MAKKDYYETLGISKGASETDIKKAFRSKAREHHPDKNAGSSKAEEEFKAVNEAYDVLKDPNKKAAYDQYGHPRGSPFCGQCLDQGCFDAEDVSPK